MNQAVPEERARGQRTIRRVSPVGILVFLAAGALAAAPDAAAPEGAGPGEPPLVTPGDNSVRLVTDFLLLRDDERTRTIATVAAPGFDGFVRVANESHALNLGLYTGALWLKLRLASGGQAGPFYLEIDNPGLDRIDFFRRRPTGGFETSTLGDGFAFSDRPVRHRLFILPVELDETPRDFYLRIESGSPMILPMRLWTVRAFVERDRVRQSLLGAYYGIAAVMVFYNLILFLTLRDRSYLYYTLYIGSFAGFMATLNGLPMEWLWGDWPRVNDPATLLCVSLSLIFGAQFGRSFLLSEKLRGHDLLLKSMIVLSPLPLVWYLCGLPPRWSTVGVNVISIIGSATMLSASLLRLRQGYRPALYYFVGWTVFLVGVILYSLRNLRALPDSFLTHHSMQIGSAVEMILLSLALGYRFNLLRSEKLRAEQETARQRLALLDSFSRFVPREFLNYLGYEDLTRIRPGDSRRLRMSVLFTDIRGFTSLSEKSESAVVFGLLNEYLAAMEPVIRRHGGFIDKFIGDAIMALFPEQDGHADGALRAALEMRTQLGRFNAAGRERGRLELRIGIGIHHGELVLGTIGSPSRLETTVIGDTVNMASRLESATKDVPSGLIVSADFVAALERPEDYPLRRIDAIVLRGKERPVAVYELSGGQE